MRRIARRFGMAVAASLTMAGSTLAQQTDTAYTRQIRDFTTDTLFLPASVATMPHDTGVPSPLDHFGTIIGAPGVMHHTSEIYAYLDTLASASPRVRVEKLGTTEEGRDIRLVIIADEATMGRLDQYRAALARLGDPRQVPASRVAEVIGTAKPIYYLNGGLHSPEMGSPEMLMELAYRLAVSDAPAIRHIRDNVIVLINPVSEPDGRDKQVDWYYRYTKGRPKWDDGFPRSVMYWGRYVVHDNNRDGLQISQAVTRALFKAYYDWHPLVMHDLHESIPLLYISTGTGPYNYTNDPIMQSEWQLLANNDITRLNAQGVPGVWTWAFFDGWWPGYAVWVANNHNSIGRFFETFGNAGADTYTRDLSNSRFAGDPVTSRQWYRAWPPTKKVRWSARDNVNYMEAGVLASLTFAADNGPELLHDYWQKGLNSLTRGLEKTPHAFLIPGFARQRDPRRTAYLVNQLRRQAIEVQERTVGDSAGDFVVLLNQPYRDLAVNLLTTQNYPASAKYPPYDDIAWTLQYLYGVDVKPIDDPAVFQWPGLTPVRDTVAFQGRVEGTGGDGYFIAYKGQDEVLPALYWLKQKASRAKPWVLEETLTSASDTLLPGSVYLQGVSTTVANDLATRFSLVLRADSAPPDSSPHHLLDLPRVAIYHTWYSTQDEGWARYTFEQTGVPYTSISKDDLRKGDLRKRFDVILVPNVGGSVETLIHGVDSKWGPLPYTKTKEFPSHGTPDSTDDITGGPGFEGMAHLEEFVRAGGTIVTLANATRMVAETGIARPLSPRSTGGLFHPGSVVRARRRSATSPILYGYPETFQLFRGNAALYQVADRDSTLVILQYGTKLKEKEPDGPIMGIPATETPAPTDTAASSDSTRNASAGRSARASTRAEFFGGGPTGEGPYVLSGLVRNENQIVGQGAIFDVPVGQGHVVAFTFDPLHRFLNHHEFPLVWNTLLNWDHLR